MVVKTPPIAGKHMIKNIREQKWTSKTRKAKTGKRLCMLFYIMCKFRFRFFAEVFAGAMGIVKLALAGSRMQHSQVGSVLGP